jgi:hypothetical protein
VPLRGKLAHLGWAVLIATLVLLPWLVANKLLFGSLTQVGLPPPPPIATDPIYQAIYVWTTFWNGSPQETAIDKAKGFLILMDIIAIAAMIGLGALLLRAKPARRDLMEIGLVAILGQVGAVYAMPLISHIDWNPPGRYLYPTLAVLVCLLLAGLGTSLRFTQRYYTLVLVSFLTTYVSFSAYALIGYVTISDVSVAEGHPGSTALDYSLSGEVHADGLEIVVDRSQIDNSQGLLWLHLTVHNQSNASIDWTPIPLLVLDGKSQDNATPYLFYYNGVDRSLTTTLAPDAHEMGWVPVPIAVSKLQSAIQISASFTDITEANYSDLQVAIIVLRSA